MAELLKKLYDLLLKLKEFFITPVDAQKQPQNTPNPPIIPPHTDNLPTTSPIAPNTPISRINEMAQAIADFEDSTKFYKNYYNPGNLKYTQYTASLGAYAKGKNNFCMFRSYDDGFNALCQFIKDAGNNELKDYHDCDLSGFFKFYSGDQNEANYCANKLKVAITTKVKDLL